MYISTFSQPETTIFHDFVARPHTYRIPRWGVPQPSMDGVLGGRIHFCAQTHLSSRFEVEKCKKPKLDILGYGNQCWEPHHAGPKMHCLDVFLCVESNSALKNTLTWRFVAQKWRKLKNCTFRVTVGRLCHQLTFSCFRIFRRGFLHSIAYSILQGGKKV